MGVAHWLSEPNGQPFMRTLAKLTALIATGFALSLGVAQAGPLGDSSSFNTPIGMSSSAQENQTINPSLRDSNGNLTMVDGEFQSSSFQAGYGMPGPNVNGQGGVGGLTNSINGTTSGNGNSGAAYGGSTAIGNSLNVVTVGSGNTVIVNSTQTNNGNQTATTNMNGN
jgi:holdfast attachment protein HfaA